MRYTSLADLSAICAGIAASFSLVFAMGVVDKSVAAAGTIAPLAIFLFGVLFSRREKDIY